MGDISLDQRVRRRSNRERWGLRQDQSRGWGQRSTYGRDKGAGMLRRMPLRVDAWSSPYANAKSFSRARDLMLRHDLLHDGAKAAGLTGIETGTKLYVSNLDYKVSNEDIKDLFSEIGELRRFTIHYDRNGRSIGSAEVVFTKRNDALAAVKRYDNVLLDGRPLKVEVVGTNFGTPMSARVSVTRVNGRGRRKVVMTSQMNQRPGSMPFNRAPRVPRGGFKRGGGHRGRGRGKKPVEKSAAELDKELESYHADAMQT